MPNPQLSTRHLHHALRTSAFVYRRRRRRLATSPHRSASYSTTNDVNHAAMPNPFHAGYKLAWLEQVANDGKASDFQVRVAIALSRRADRFGVANAGQEGLATFIGATSRGVRNALRDLAANEHISAKTNSVGGRGIVGRYRLLLKKEPPGESSGDERRNGETRNDQDPAPESRNENAANLEQGDRKPGTAVPPLPYSSIKDSLGNGACDEALRRDHAAILHGATQRYGVDLVASWFARLKLDGIKDGVGIVVAPTRFIADHVSTQYGDHILRWWRQERPSVQRLHFIVRA